MSFGCDDPWGKAVTVARAAEENNFSRKSALKLSNFVILPPKLKNMNKIKTYALLILSAFATSFAFAQNGVSIGSWRTHLPYQKVIAVEPVGQKVFAATNYEVFYYDTEDNSIHILNKINGLSDVGISTMGYCESQRKLLPEARFLLHSENQLDCCRAFLVNPADVQQ